MEGIELNGDLKEETSGIKFGITMTDKRVWNVKASLPSLSWNLEQVQWWGVFRKMQILFVVLKKQILHKKMKKYKGGVINTAVARLETEFTS